MVTASEVSNNTSTRLYRFIPLHVDKVFHNRYPHGIKIIREMCKFRNRYFGLIMPSLWWRNHFLR